MDNRDEACHFTPSLARLSAGIFLLSLGILTVEITLTRIFSFTISYHFAYLTIAVALLGFGSAGSLLAVWPDMLGGVRRRLVVSCATAAIATIMTLAFSSVVRFNPIRIGSNPEAMAILALYYLVVTIPFLCGGLAVVTVFAARPEKIGRLYAWDLLGAGLGCAVSVPLIWVVETPAAVVTAALALGGAALVFSENDKRLRRWSLAATVGTLLLGLLVVRVGPFPPSPGKFLSQFLNSPGVHHLFKRWTPINRVDAVGWDPTEGSWRGSYAVAGVSPFFRGRGPEFRMIGYDGGSFAVMYQYKGRSNELDLFRHHVMAAPYQILQRPKTLIIGLGGGADALAGIANGVGPMTGLELNPVTVELGKHRFRDFNGDLFNSRGLDVVAAEARHWVESNDETFDLIVLNSIDTLAALSSGAYVLAESYLYTTQAFAKYLDRLSPNGIYALFSFDNNGIAGPTFIILRYAETLRAALQSLGATDPKANMVIMAGHEDVPLVATLVKRTPFSSEEMARLTTFAEREGFEFWHRPDRQTEHQVGTYLWMSNEDRQSVLEKHFLRLAPVTDDSPFFFNFYKWRSLLWKHPEDTGTTPATGQRMLIVMLVQAIVFSAVMILWPLRRIRHAEPIDYPLGFLAYFSALGFGFILLEISLMQRFVLFLGFPTYSLSVVLFSLLTFTGIGSVATSRVGPPTTAKPRLALGILIVLVGIFIAFAPALFRANLDQPLATRIGLSVLLIAPLGLILGTFFPLGIRMVEITDRRLVPWAWAVNGCTTVVGTIVATMVAMAYGFDVVMVLALAVYVAGIVALGRTDRKVPANCT